MRLAPLRSASLRSGQILLFSASIGSKFLPFFLRIVRHISLKNSVEVLGQFGLKHEKIDAFYSIFVLSRILALT